MPARCLVWPAGRRFIEGITLRLFCYGTLQFPEIMERVCGLHASGVPAMLDNHDCFTVRGEVYPGIVPRSGAQTPGMVYSGLGMAQLQKLDAFESDCYERRRVMVCDVRERSLEAWVYVMREGLDGLLSDERWNRELFRRIYLKGFLQRLGGGGSGT